MTAQWTRGWKMGIARLFVGLGASCLLPLSMGCQPAAEVSDATPARKAASTHQAGSALQVASKSLGVKPGQAIVAAAPDEPAGSPLAPPAPAAEPQIDSTKKSPSEANSAVSAQRLALLGDLLAQHPRPLWRPAVVLSGQHAAESMLRAGQVLPEIVAERDGDLISLNQELRERFATGDGLAVILFWNAGHPYAREQYERLAEEVVAPFAPLGVCVATIHTGHDPAAGVPAAEAASSIDLADGDGSAFAAVARQKLPRVYLINREQQVLWFDIEYSRSTQRELRNALLYYLKQSLDAA